MNADNTVSYTAGYTPAAAAISRYAAAGIRGAEQGGAGHEDASRRPARRRRRCSVSMPPSTSSAGPGADQRPQALDLAGLAGMNGWPPQPGLTVMHEREIEVGGDLAEHAHGRGRADRHPGGAARLLDRADRVVDVRRGLGVERDVVGARPWRTRDLALGALDHQVHVDQRAGGVDAVGERGDDERPHRDRRHEVAVHDVDVDDARAGVEHLADLVPEAGEVGGQDRGGDAVQLGHQIGWSIELPQLLHAYSAVSDMRTMVECSPQLGQTELNSKRVQAVHAAVAAGQVGRAQPRLVAGRAHRPEVDVRRRSRRSAPAQPGDEEPLGAVAVRQRLEVKGHGWMLPDGDLAGAGRRPRSPRDRPGSRRSRPRSRRARSCRWSRRACRRARSASAPARRIAPCVRASRSGWSAVLRQRASGRLASVPRSEHGGSTSTRS